MTREDLAGLPDGATVRRLSSGLEIVRRRKHEPVDLEGLGRKDTAKLTGKRLGSKFSGEWGMARLTDWIAREVDSRGWTTGEPRQADVLLDDPVGIVSGELVSTIRIMSDGRYVHAFPVEDRR